MYDLLRALCLIACSAASAAAADLPGDVPLTAAFAEKLVTDELRSTGVGDAFDVTVERPSLPLGNQETAPTTVVLKGLRHDPTNGRFSAVLVGTVGETPRFQLPVRGWARPLVSVAVLGRAVGRGEQISAADLDWIKMAPNALPKASLTDEHQLVGAEARRRLTPGRVLTSRDVGPRRLVLRGQPVRIVYAEHGLKLTALGTARDDGGFGEPIRVVNPESRLEIQGIATGPSEVTVGSAVMPGAGY